MLFCFLYLVCFVVSTYVTCIWACWILMAFANLTTYLLKKLPHGHATGQYNCNGKQIELFYMKWFNWG